MDAQYEAYQVLDCVRSSQLDAIADVYNCANLDWWRDRGAHVYKLITGGFPAALAAIILWYAESLAIIRTPIRTNMERVYVMIDSVRISDVMKFHPRALTALMIYHRVFPMLCPKCIWVDCDHRVEKVAEFEQQVARGELVPVPSYTKLANWYAETCGRKYSSLRAARDVSVEWC